MIKTIIVDDERLARKELRSLIERIDDIEILSEASNAHEALEQIEEHQPDLIFLDIQMPGKTGFELLEELASVPNVIFTTAYDEFALKAFELNALDYLLKPIEPKRLEEAVGKFRLNIEKQISKESKNEEFPLTNKLLGDDQVFLKDGDKCWFVKLSDISLFESDGNYVKVYFDKYKPLIHRSLNALDEKLDEKLFFRASRKYIINLRWIEKIEPWFNGGLMVELKNGKQVEISRRQATKFKDRLSL